MPPGTNLPAPPPSTPPKAAPKEPGIDRRLFRRIIGLLLPYRGLVLVALGGVIAAAILGPLRPRLVQIAIDRYVVPGDRPGLDAFLPLLLGVLAAESFLAFFNGYLTQWIGQKAIRDLRTRVFNHLTRQPLAYFDRTPLGRLITRTTSDVESLSDVLSAGVVTILGDLLKLVFIAYFMFTLDWRLALIALSVLPPMVWATSVLPQEDARAVPRDAHAGGPPQLLLAGARGGDERGAAVRA